MKKLIEH